MPSNKDRLYVGLYARGGQQKMPGLEDTYHWALLTAPKDFVCAKGPGVEINHVKEKLVLKGEPPVIMGRWEYINATDEHGILLVRILVGKVKNMQRLQQVLRANPLRPDLPSWNCVYWVKEALERAGQDSEALSSCVSNWQTVRDTAMWYVEGKKAAHRFDGEGDFDLSKTATWDLLSGKELVI